MPNCYHSLCLHTTNIVINTKLKLLKEIMSTFHYTTPYFHILAALIGTDHPKIEISPSHHYADGGSGDILHPT